MLLDLTKTPDLVPVELLAATLLVLSVVEQSVELLAVEPLVVLLVVESVVVLLAVWVLAIRLADLPVVWLYRIRVATHLEQLFLVCRRPCLE
jgi:hypothetical protein